MSDVIQWFIGVGTNMLWMMAIVFIMFTVMLIICHFLPERPAEPEQADEQPEAIN